MRPRVLYELSHQLALLLERGLSEDPEEGRVPVFVCHPLDSLGDAQGDPAARGAVGVLYLARLVPERRVAPNGLRLRPRHPSHGSDEGAGTLPIEGLEELRYPDLWVRARFVFLVGGGDLETQYTVMAAALRALHDNPEIRLESGEDAPAYPLRLVSDRRGFQDLALAEHRLTVTFEVTVNIPSGRVERVERTLEREVLVDATDFTQEKGGF